MTGESNEQKEEEIRDRDRKRESKEERLKKTRQIKKCRGRSK